MSQEDNPSSTNVAENEPAAAAAAAATTSESETVAAAPVDPPEQQATEEKPPAPPASENPAASPESEEPVEEEEEKGEVSKKKDIETATDATAESEKALEEKTHSSNIIVSASRKSRPPYKYDPNKITLRFLFANRDGLTVTVECNPSDTVGEVKGALISVWPGGESQEQATSAAGNRKLHNDQPVCIFSFHFAAFLTLSFRVLKSDMPDCNSGESLRLICMGKGFLTPDTRTLEDCHIPVFKTHPTPVNVSLKPPPKHHEGLVEHFKKKTAAAASGTGTASTLANTNETNQGCGCTIQ